MKTLFKIGEIAELFRLNIKTLRYYDEIDLVKPEVVDPDTGYRYYSTGQFEQLNTIRYLRELDVPLSEIHDFLHNRETEKMEQILQTQIAQVEHFRKLEGKILPPDMDYLHMEGLRLEARQKLDRIRPANVGQAGRISGISPADVAVLLVCLQKYNQLKGREQAESEDRHE